MELTEAINALQDLVNYERGFQKYDAGNYQPDKVRRMLDEKGIDISPLRFIHVAGTNGKGSVSLYAANLLNASGLRAGLYTSPHLFTPLERISVAGEDIPEAEFCGLVAEFIDFFRETAATYFEALTFAAIVHFIRSGCDYAVLETGLGGRLDSTNFCIPEVSVITPIGFDHTLLLGDTLSAIAVEKAGIIKPGVPVVVSPQASEAMDALAANAASKGSPLVRFDENVKYSITKRDAGGSVFDAALPSTVLKNVAFTRMGDRLVENFLTALLALKTAGMRSAETLSPPPREFISRSAANFTAARS
jgi:dihydrofolate synthase/folylpolyglutamate synthase